MQPSQGERSLSELVATMTEDVSTLMRKEVELAKEELRVEARRAGKAGAGFAGAGVSGLYAGIALVMAIGFALDELLPTWLGFLLIALVLGAVAAVFAQRGQRELQELNPAPEQTIETMKENAQWLSEQRN
ncbi:phage holin family protein [Aquihabitans sp. McL0605]|uniref:phage holin family protein n=1 Tax=Aquihabitans sp. McL0605 TaxID=3415671 RepID=UPI003CE9B7E3